MDTTDLKAALAGTGKSVNEFLKGFGEFAQEKAGAGVDLTTMGAKWWKDQFDAYIIDDASGVKTVATNKFTAFRDKVFPASGFDAKALWGEINGAAKSVADDGYGIWKAIKNNWAFPVGAAAGFGIVTIFGKWIWDGIFGDERGETSGIMGTLGWIVAGLFGVTAAYAGSHWLGKWAHGAKPADDKDPAAAGLVTATAVGSPENAEKYAELLERASKLVNGRKRDETGMLGSGMYMLTQGAAPLVGAILTESKDDLKDSIITKEELAHLERMFDRGVQKAKDDGHVVNVSQADIGRKPATLFKEIKAAEAEARAIK